MAVSRAAVRAAGRRLFRRGARGVRGTMAGRRGLIGYLAILGGTCAGADDDSSHCTSKVNALRARLSEARLFM